MNIDDIYVAYKQLEKKYPEKEFWGICLALPQFGIDGTSLIIRDWKTRTQEEESHKSIMCAFHAELKKLLENRV